MAIIRPPNSHWAASSGRITELRWEDRINDKKEVEARKAKVGEQTSEVDGEYSRREEPECVCKK